MKLLLLLLLSLSPTYGQILDLSAANREFDYVDQKNGVGNSCGPASLLNSFGAGTERWQKAYLQIPGSSDRARIASVIKSWGLQPSTTFTNRSRWQQRGGVNFEDLAAMAEDMRKIHWTLPKVKSELFFSAPGSESVGQLKLAHKRLSKSFDKGMPPILSVRRFVLRKGIWQSVHGHFVVLTAMPSKLNRGETSFPVTLVDPVGAKSFVGTVTIADSRTSLPCLILNCPTNPVGKTAVQSGERHALGLAGAIGAW
ncbi:hypothetical protein [Roseibacillus persicicus]|uniref:hypothetical protein n=1 Tax=Roseibacillus persicicus TaxID=454148 RepID=UPI00280DB291|nr:hypothetical protein [Roseibacillus persicicus]MDQ8189520.1 hypothetical protein [Roseibacillus persicicus]